MNGLVLYRKRILYVDNCKFEISPLTPPPPPSPVTVLKHHIWWDVLPKIDLFDTILSVVKMPGWKWKEKCILDCVLSSIFDPDKGGRVGYSIFFSYIIPWNIAIPNTINHHSFIRKCYCQSRKQQKKRKKKLLLLLKLLHHLYTNVQSIFYYSVLFRLNLLLYSF